MTNFIPVFPLGIVVYPGEILNLHIFEPRYKQLISECAAAGKPFGIPVVVNDSIMDHGTLISITRIEKTYDDGKMDIRCLGGDVFRLLEYVATIPDKLYSGAIVTYPQNNLGHHPEMLRRILAALRQLHSLLSIEKTYKKPDHQLRSYDIAHHAGLNLEQEYQLLLLLREDQRLEYLKRHLHSVLPVLKEMETLKERVKLNGHFRELKSLGF
jgi:Lon protease-like protein